MTNIVKEKVHISTIKPGDTVEHEGEIRTVCRNNITNDPFAGVQLFGYGYSLEKKLVTKCSFLVPTAFGIVKR